MAEAVNEAIGPGEAEAAAPPPPRRIEVWLPIVIVALDQLTKFVVNRTVPLHASVTVIPGLVDFTHVRNSGAAFGILNAVEFPFKSTVIAVIATAALIGVGMYAASLAHHQLVARIGLALIIGGAADLARIEATPAPPFGILARSHRGVAAHSLDLAHVVR